MDIKDAVKRRKKLEEDIAVLVYNFTVETGIVVDQINIRNNKIINSSSNEIEAVYYGAEITATI